MIIDGVEYYGQDMLSGEYYPADADTFELFTRTESGEYLEYDGPRPVIEVAEKKQKPTPALLGIEPADAEPLPVSTVEDQFTDMRMAAVFSAMFKHVLRYWAESGKWLVFDGIRWTTGAPGGAHVYIRKMIESLYKMAVDCADYVQRAGMLKAILKLETHARHEAILSCARTRPELIATASSLDQHRMLINVLNGTLNLETVSLQPHNADDLMTRTIHLEYDPNAKCPQFIAFLHRIFDGNQDIISFLQRFIGYCLTGRTTEQVFLFFYGLGANGKSVLLNIIRELFGDFASTANSDLLMVQDSRGATNDIAALRGARVVTISELNDGARIDEARVKSLTGGDPVTCRFLFKEPFTYIFEGKLFLAGNYKPKVKGTDHGIWRRKLLVPFEVTIPEEERDPYLQDKLTKELPGILVWAVQGCAEWQRVGLKPPEEVKAATAEYRQQEDVFAQWIEECCITGDHMMSTAHDLLASFIDYSKWKGTTSTKLGRMLAAAGFIRDRATGSSRWRGIGLTTATDNRHWQDRNDDKDLPF